MARTTPAPVTVVTTAPAAPAPVASPASPVAHLRTALAAVAGLTLPTSLAVADAAALYILSQRLTKLAGTVADAAKPAILAHLASLPEGVDRRLQGADGSILYVAPGESRSDDHKADAEALRRAILAAAVALREAGRDADADAAIFAGNRPAPVKVTPRAASLRVGT